MTSDAHKAPRSHGDGREAVGRSILLSVAEAASLTGLSESHIRRHAPLAAPTPCTCRVCARPCVWTIRGDLHWVTCRSCRRGKHRSGAL